MELFEAMRSTFAAREFTDAPVDDGTLYRIFENARFAPSGGNRQGWKVVIVRDPGTKARCAKWAEPTMRRYVAQMLGTMMAAPVVLLVCVDLSVLACFDAQLDRVGIVGGASVYPFVWNLLLAARAEGLAGTLTTFLVPAEAEVRAQLGIPEHFAIAALLPLGHPPKQLTRLKRKSVEEITCLERWGDPPLRS